MELDKVTLPVVLRNLHEYDNQLSDTCTGFDHRFPRIALRGGHAKKKSPRLHCHEWMREACRTSTASWPFVERGLCIYIQAHTQTVTELIRQLSPVCRPLHTETPSCFPPESVHRQDCLLVSMAQDHIRRVLPHFYHNNTAVVQNVHARQRCRCSPTAAWMFRRARTSITATACLRQAKRSGGSARSPNLQTSTAPTRSTCAISTTTGGRSSLIRPEAPPTIETEVVGAFHKEVRSQKSEAKIKQLSILASDFWLLTSHAECHHGQRRIITSTSPDTERQAQHFPETVFVRSEA